MSKLIHYDLIEGHIAILTLNRPEKMNALSHALLIELEEYLNTLKQEHHVRAIVITGKGEKAFCAGADLKERRGMTHDETMRAVKQIGKIINLISEQPIPVIAAINGAAFGGGLELALACDIRLCATDAQVGLTETSLAIIPGAGGTQRLSRLIGTGQAKKMIFTAQPISAREGFRIGLLEAVYEKDALMSETITIAKQIAKNGPFAIRLAKAAIDNGLETNLHTALEMERVYYEQTMTTEDRIEGLTAFQEKRKPNYNGK